MPQYGPASPLCLQASAHGDTPDEHSPGQVYHTLVPVTADGTTFLELGYVGVNANRCLWENPAALQWLAGQRSLAHGLAR